MRAAAALPLILAACATGPQPLVNDRQGLAPARSAPAPEEVPPLEVGHRLMDAGEFDLAIRAYTRAALADGVTVEVMTALGTAHLALRRLVQAEKHFRRALDLDDAYIPALNNLGVALDAQGETGEARELFRIAFALSDGESEEIRDNLRLLDAKLENFGATPVDSNDFRLVRQGNGQYLLVAN